MTSTMDLIRTKHLELSAHELENCYNCLRLHFSICKHGPISTKLGQSMYDQQISNEFGYESTWTGTTSVNCS